MHQDEGQPGHPVTQEDNKEQQNVTHIRKKYKLHALSVAQGYGRSARTESFMETEEEALEKAAEIVENDPKCQGIVIYKAVKVVRPRYKPIIIEDVE